METIHHIKTGGTIGGCVNEYPEITTLGKMFPDMIDLDKYLTASLKMFAQYSEEVACHKDSREITDEDRARIVKMIEARYSEGAKKFLVTHGTFTMPETGKFLLEHLSKKVLDDSQIIITGSMFPWILMGSDAQLNLGAALGLLINSDESRVAICMHAKLFDPLHVKKDAENLIFEEN